MMSPDQTHAHLQKGVRNGEEAGRNRQTGQEKGTHDA